MTRKKFIEENGGECANWTWSWSFVNHSKKFVFFGIWEECDLGDIGLILSRDWETNRNGRVQPGFGQAKDHLKLVEEQDYNLFTFRLIPKVAGDAVKPKGPAKILSFVREMVPKHLLILDGDWYATGAKPEGFLHEEIDSEAEYREGATKTITVNAYERNKDARAECLRHFGYKCQVCNFDFGNVYGGLGSGFIHVHHIVPLSEIRKEYIVKPIEDLVPLCPNCHAMIHRTKPALTVEKLRNIIQNLP